MILCIKPIKREENMKLHKTILTLSLSLLSSLFVSSTAADENVLKSETPQVENNLPPKELLMGSSLDDKPMEEMTPLKLEIMMSEALLLGKTTSAKEKSSKDLTFDYKPMNLTTGLTSLKLAIMKLEALDKAESELQNSSRKVGFFYLIRTGSLNGFCKEMANVNSPVTEELENNRIGSCLSVSTKNLNIKELKAPLEKNVNKEGATFFVLNSKAADVYCSAISIKHGIMSDKFFKDFSEKAHSKHEEKQLYLNCLNMVTEQSVREM